VEWPLFEQDGGLSQEEETTLIGWQGISARVPADWTLAGVGGDRRSGYLRVDYERTPRLQVKWSSRHIDLEKKRAEYVKRLKVGKRRRPTGLEVTTDLRVVSKRAKPKKDILTYGWRGPQCGMGVLWNCDVCGRAIIAQVGWPLEEEGREVAQEVLESLEDHGTAGWDAWGVDGLVFLGPTGYELEGWRRMTRYLELRLLRKQEKLKVARWGMVPLVLGQLSVREWYEATNRRRRDVVWRSEEAEIKGHDGVVAWGERRRLAGGVRTRAARALRRKPVVEFGACAWHCPESNRLYLVELLYGGEGEALHGAVESIMCHEEA
jgi:hypothetical protein